MSPRNIYIFFYLEDNVFDYLHVSQGSFLKVFLTKWRIIQFNQIMPSATFKKQGKSKDWSFTALSRLLHLYQAD